VWSEIWVYWNPPITRHELLDNDFATLWNELGLPERDRPTTFFGLISSISSEKLISFISSNFLPSDSIIFSENSFSIKPANLWKDFGKCMLLLTVITLLSIVWM